MGPEIMTFTNITISHNAKHNHSKNRIKTQQKTIIYRNIYITFVHSKLSKQHGHHLKTCSLTLTHYIKNMFPLGNRNHVLSFYNKPVTGFALILPSL